jgi:hypothetical protein
MKLMQTKLGDYVKELINEEAIEFESSPLSKKFETELSYRFSRFDIFQSKINQCPPLNIYVAIRMQTSE